MLLLWLIIIGIGGQDSGHVQAGVLDSYMTLDERETIFGDQNPEYEIIYLTNLPPQMQGGEVPYGLNAFGRDIRLLLRPNQHITAPEFQVIIRDAGDNRTLDGQPKPCHYLHTDRDTAAAFSFCEDDRVHGILFLGNDTLEIQPVPVRFHSLLEGDREAITDQGSTTPHMVKRAHNLAHLDHADHDDIRLRLDVEPSELTTAKRDARGPGKRLTIETALFFDEAGYKTFTPYFQNNDEKLRDMLLAYINGVQALYHHQSLGQLFDIVLVRMELFKRQPSDLPHYDGERNKLLDSFCSYSEKHNAKEDASPKHWDMALYVSGLDFFAYENGRKSGVTMGLATVGGVCIEKYNCIIAELGTTNVFGKPYPSAGFTSVYILAHEMGHNLGMHHDSSGNSCPKEGYIMSPSRGTNGETLWSPCSAEVAASMSWAKCLQDRPTGKPGQGMDHSKYEDLPGEVWGAKKQCEVLLRDKDAVLYNPDRMQDICENLQCKTPHRSGFYFAGPALEGTNCGGNKWCQGGSCVNRKKKPDKVVQGGWTDWKPAQECSSGCIQKSRGFQSRRRTCTNPAPVNTEEGCEGPGYSVVLCKDDKMCKKRKSVTDFATTRCQDFSKHIPELDRKGSGLQAPHEEARMWMGCAIFCRRKDTGAYYTPRLELNDMGVDPYFPDGTWCHNDGKMNHYCLQHHCLPENFNIVKEIFISEDVPLPQNAPPRIIPLADEILQYLSIDSNRKPLLTTLKPGQTKPPSEEEWDDKDYIEIHQADEYTQDQY